MASCLGPQVRLHMMTKKWAARTSWHNCRSTEQLHCFRESTTKAWCDSLHPPVGHTRRMASANSRSASNWRFLVSGEFCPTSSMSDVKLARHEKSAQESRGLSRLCDLSGGQAKTPSPQLEKRDVHVDASLPASAGL